MSHGPSSSEAVEPNLTPLLDLVLQLLMFFMICGNYASEQSNEPVNLAFSETAKQLSDDANLKPGDKQEQDFLFLTVKPYHPDTNNGDLVQSHRRRVAHGGHGQVQGRRRLRADRRPGRHEAGRRACWSGSRPSTTTS